MSRSWRLFVNDILGSCEQVRRYRRGMDKEQFLANDCAYDAVLRNIEIIGEAVKHLPPDIRDQISGVEWTKVVGTRDWLAHGYLGLDNEVVWTVIPGRLPELEQAVRTFLDERTQSAESE